MSMHIIPVQSQQEIDIIRNLFMEYARSLDFDLGFQNFEDELSELPGRYASPDGRLLLGLVGDEPAGCVALRKLAPEICEMKRLWVRPSFRGKGLGRQLAAAVIEEAVTAGYHLMRLDTVASMSSAVSLYRQIGFYETTPYTHNPLSNALFLEKSLRDRHG
ncbi:MAG TPA: GNAT family N-acetyltransferase [Planctomicrobium sp.]|nr:GNAT family N-acetyltransferase [Planctomicrobium sp.]